MADAAQERAHRSYAWGPLSALGLWIAVLTCGIDQAAKFWLVYGLDIASRGQIDLTSFVALALTWNTGISYGLLPQEGAFGQWALLAFKAAVVVLLWIWLARAPSRLTGIALGLIIGGAVGNGIDGLHWPGVMDFVLVHVEAATWTFRWYMFNLADVAIVAGVVGLLYEALLPGATKAP